MKKMVHCDDFEVLKSLGTTFELDVEGVGCCCHFVLELLLYKVFCLLKEARFSNLKIISLLVAVHKLCRFGRKGG